MDIRQKRNILTAALLMLFSGAADAFDPYFWIPDAAKDYSTEKILRKFYRPSLMQISQALPVVECVRKRNPNALDIHPSLSSASLSAIRADVKAGYDKTLSATEAGIIIWSGDSAGYKMARADRDALKEIWDELGDIIREGAKVGCNYEKPDEVKWNVGKKKKKTPKALKQYVKASDQLDYMVRLSDCELKSQGEVSHDREALLSLRDRIATGHKTAKEAVESGEMVWYGGTDNFRNYSLHAKAWKSTRSVFADIYVEPTASQCMFPN